MVSFFKNNVLVFEILTANLNFLWMKYLLFLIFVSISCYLPIFSQSIQENYGNDSTHGKYYGIRGIDMYAEIYGSGKPLLMIHGNGGSISSFKKNIAFFAKNNRSIKSCNAL